MSEFNVGDKVRIKPNYGDGRGVGYVGRVGTVVEKYMGFSQMVHKVQLEGDGPSHAHPYAHEISPEPVGTSTTAPNLTNSEWIYLALSLNEAKNLGFPQAVDIHEKIMDYLGAR